MPSIANRQTDPLVLGDGPYSFLAVVSVCWVVICIVTPATAGQDAKNTDLQEAWDNCPVTLQPATAVTADAVKQLRLEVLEVDRFCINRLEQYSPGKLRGGEQTIFRMRTIYSAQPARGCVWQIAASRRMHNRALAAGITAAPEEVRRYQEWVQFMVYLLQDNSEKPFGRISPQAPPGLEEYDDRMCDLAYRGLCAQWGNGEVAETIAKATGWELPFRPLSKSTPHADRDRQIEHLAKVVVDEQMRRIIGRSPRALKEIQKSDMDGASDAMMECATAWLSRMTPRVMADDLLPLKPVSLRRAIEKEYPKWSDKEEKTIQMLHDQKYSPRDIVVRLQQQVRRNRGLVEPVSYTHLRAHET